MAKKIFFMVAMIWSLYVSSQNTVGDWRIHSSFVGSDVTTVVESDNWVYYLSGAHLFRLDKQTQENEALSKLNLLSDMGIDNIYYNYDKDYLVVVYTNTNIDIILTDGSVINMPEIKDAVMTSSKTINDVTFAPGKIYLATGFGYAVIDDTKFVFKESHIYGESLRSVAQVGDLLLVTTTNSFYYGNAGDYHEHLSSFNVGSNKVDCPIRVINENSFFCMTSKTYRTIMSYRNDGSLKFTSEVVIDSKASDIQRTENGFLLNVNDPKKRGSYITDEEGKNPVTLDSDGEMCSSHPDSHGQIWAAGIQGLHQLGSDNFYLPNALTMPQPFWMTYNKEKDLLYVSSTGTNYFFKESFPCQVNTFDGIQWSDVTPEDAPVDGSYWLEFMPGDPDTYFMSTWKKGLLKVKNNEIVYTYNPDNSPMVKRSIIHPITSVDRNGNIWCVQTFENRDHPVMALQASKTKQSEVTANDWATPVIRGDIYTGDYPEEQQTTKRASFISTHFGNNDIKIFTDGDYQRPLFVWDCAGEIPSQPQRQESYKQLSDQDGQVVSWTYTMCLTEDLNGNVWMGTTEGICMFNPAKAFPSTSFSVVRPKVPRDDGTGYADRLMDGIQVNDVAVDGANRKWIATESSGLFLVNSDGTQIIKKFNTTNSPLATNTIYKVCCNPNSNSVYMTTPAGLYEYFSDSSPAASNYDNIYAYPNPVRPDYLGEVTIMGLMDNSLIKIADASGHVINQLKSTGGMATWDCCDHQGNVVKSGVYFVLCSQANGGNEAVVTKIAVIR